jgi:hypothetical protein
MATFHRLMAVIVGLAAGAIFFFGGVYLVYIAAEWAVKDGFTGAWVLMVAFFIAIAIIHDLKKDGEIPTPFGWTWRPKFFRRPIAPHLGPDLELRPDEYRREEPR